MYKITTNSAAQTRQLGETLGSLLQPGDFISLHGDLGSGKTCLAGGVGNGLGVTGRVKSPTFTLINEYEGKIPLFHMDAYRLDQPEEIEDLGYEHYFYGPGATLVEWAGIIESYLPECRLDITIVRSPVSEEERVIELVPHGKRHEQLVREMMRHVCAGD